MKSKLLLSAIGLLLAFAPFAGSANADLIPFDLLDPSGVAGTAGEALESTGSVTIGGVTINVGAASSITGSTGADFSANASTAGINTGGVTGGDGASELDLGETLTFTFTFGSETVSLNEIDFSGVGGNAGAGVSAGDAALVNVAGSSFSLFTGVTDFSGGTDTFSPDGGITLASGDTIVISAEETIVIQGITLHVKPATVPEPSSLAVLGIGCVAGLMRRRRTSVK